MTPSCRGRKYRLSTGITDVNVCAQFEDGESGQLAENQANVVDALRYRDRDDCTDRVIILKHAISLREAYEGVLPELVAYWAARCSRVARPERERLRSPKV